jgi:hypothetical protein
VAGAVEGAISSVHAASDDSPIVDEDATDGGLVCVEGKLCLFSLSMGTLMGLLR